MRTLAGLEFGVLAGLLTEFWLLFFAWIAGWGGPGWGAVALHIAVCGVAGIVLGNLGFRLSGMTALLMGFLYAFALYWFTHRYVWNWFLGIGPVQAPWWGYWIAGFVAGLTFALIPGRARSFEREFLLK